MITDSAKILNDVMLDIRDQIISNANSQDRNLQNKIPKSLIVEITEDGSKVRGVLYGWKWILQAWEVGRGKTVNKSTGITLAEKLRTWVRLRGLASDEKGIKSIAYLIARKIHKSGTAQFRSGQASGVISDVTIKDFENQVKNAYIRSVKTEIQELLNNRQ